MCNVMISERKNLVLTQCEFLNLKKLEDIKINFFLKIFLSNFFDFWLF